MKTKSILKKMQKMKKILMIIICRNLKKLNKKILKVEAPYPLRCLELLIRRVTLKPKLSQKVKNRKIKFSRDFNKLSCSPLLTIKKEKLSLEQWKNTHTTLVTGLFNKEKMENICMSLTRESLIATKSSVKIKKLPHIWKHISLVKVLENFLYFIMLQELLLSKLKHLQLALD